MIYKKGDIVYTLEGILIAGRSNAEYFLTKKIVKAVGKYVTIGNSINNSTERFVPTENQKYDAFNMFKNQKSNYFKDGYQQKNSYVISFDEQENTTMVFKDLELAKQFIKLFSGIERYMYCDAVNIEKERKDEAFALIRNEVYK